MITEYPRGSEWRRWDLHVHTPASYLSNEYGDPNLETTWDNYVKELFSKALQAEICAIGITDYFSIEGYEKIIEYRSNKAKLQELGFSEDDIKKIDRILLLPNIELRLKCLVGTNRVNYHIIFSNDVPVREIKENFLENLYISYEGNPDSADYKFKLNKNNLQRLGEKLIREHQGFSGNSTLFVGAMNAVVDDNEISRILSTTKPFSDSYITIIPVDEDLSRLSWDGQDHQIRKILYQKAHCFFSSNQGTIDFGLGLKHANKKKYLEEFKTYKPCVHGSDAHSYDKIFNPDENRYCWIKADPTFNGLKQILYEPEERVKILESKPEVKENYYVIDRVEIHEDGFPTNPIYFNDKLTCIIGGKSTGKSILLQNVATHIDEEEALSNLRISNSQTVKNLYKIDMHVFWADGEEKNRKIIYIPQTYLNKLCDNEEEKTIIDRWIQDILFLRPEIKDAYERCISTINTLTIQIETKIMNFIKANGECCENINSQKEIGDKDAVITNLGSLLGIKSELSKNLNISEDDINSYNTAQSKNQLIIRNISQLTHDMKLIETMDTLIDKKEIDASLRDDIRSQMEAVQKSILDYCNKQWAVEKTGLIKYIHSKILEEQTEKDKNDLIIKEKKSLIDSSNAVMEISKRILAEEEKKKSLEEKEKQLSVLKQRRNTLLDELCFLFKKYKDANTEYMNVIKEANLFEEEIAFSAKVVFRSEVFIEKLISVYDTRSKEFQNIIKIDEFSENRYYDEILRNMIEKTIDNTLRLKASSTQEDALRVILGNWYNTIYSIEMDGDTLDIMSPGKKALVLLKILVSLAESKCPILIDQPEDDLDNRSIYDDLICFIKKKKKERQIIIVTHNANIVVGADAEEVIVANQKGKNSPNENFRFEYRAGSIENNLPSYDENGRVKSGILNKQGIQQHICDILEGGEKAFKLRKNKYHI